MAYAPVGQAAAQAVSTPRILRRWSVSHDIAKYLHIACGRQNVKRDPPGGSAPPTRLVRVGATVTRVDDDDVPHNIVSSEGKTLESPVLDTDRKFSYASTKVVTFSYTPLLREPATWQCSASPARGGRNVRGTPCLLTVPFNRNSLPSAWESPAMPLAIPILAQTMAKTLRIPFHGG